MCPLSLPNFSSGKTVCPPPSSLIKDMNWEKGFSEWQKGLSIVRMVMVFPAGVILELKTGLSWSRDYFSGTLYHLLNKRYNFSPWMQNNPLSGTRLPLPLLQILYTSQLKCPRTCHAVSVTTLPSHAGPLPLQNTSIPCSTHSSVPSLRISILVSPSLTHPKIYTNADPILRALIFTLLYYNCVYQSASLRTSWG